MKYINVNDELPPEQVRVLVAYDNGFSKTYSIDIAFYTEGGKYEFDDENEDFEECYDGKRGACFLPKGFWMQFDEEKIVQLHNVAYWTQILAAPPMPKEQKDERSVASKD